MIKLFIGLSLILVFCSLVYADENYCHDKESSKEWNAFVEKNANDMEVQALHDLRIGLCAKVDRGGITLKQATFIGSSIIAPASLIGNPQKAKKKRMPNGY